MGKNVHWLLMRQELPVFPFQTCNNYKLFGWWPNWFLTKSFKSSNQQKKKQAKTNKKQSCNERQNKFFTCKKWRISHRILKYPGCYLDLTSTHEVAKWGRRRKRKLIVKIAVNGRVMAECIILTWLCMWVNTARNWYRGNHQANLPTLVA